MTTALSSLKEPGEQSVRYTVEEKNPKTRRVLLLVVTIGKESSEVTHL